MGRRRKKKKQKEKKRFEVIKKEEKIMDLNELTPKDLNVLSKKEQDDSEVEIGNLKIVLPINVYHKLMTYTKLLNDEINGLGLVERKGEDEFVIKELYLLDQLVSKAQCEIDTDAMVKLMQQIIEEGKSPTDLKLWWHSHNSMNTFWSTTDEDTSKNFGGKDYFISIVTNHDGEMRGKINIYYPVNLTIDNVPIVVEAILPSEELIEQCKEEIKQKVRKEVNYGQNSLAFRSAFHNDINNYNVHDNKPIENKEKSTVEDDDIEYIQDDLIGYDIEPFDIYKMKGDDFIFHDTHFVWNAKDQMYYGFDIKTNIKKPAYEVNNLLEEVYEYEMMKGGI